MSEENKEKSFPEENRPEADGEWSWDASVPQTSTDNITFTELSVSSTDNSEESDNVQKPDPETDAEPEEEKFCVVCGAKITDCDSDLYCKDCCKKFLRTSYGVGHIILAFVMVILSALSYFVFVSTAKISTDLTEAQLCFEQSRYNDAVNKCSEISETVDTLNSGINAIFTRINENFTAKDWFDDGQRAVRIVIDSYGRTLSASTNNCQSYIQFVDSFFKDGELDKSENKEIKKIYDFCVDFNNMYNEVSPKIQECMKQDDKGNYSIDYDKAMKYLDGVKADNDAKKSTVEYFKFIVEYYADRDDSKIIASHIKANEAAGDMSYVFANSLMTIAWELGDTDTVLEEANKEIARNLNNSTAYYYSVKSYIMAGDYKKANEFCDTLKKNNPDSLDYFIYKAETLRREGKFEEAVNVCKDGIAKGTDAELYRQQAIAYMLLGDKTGALEAVKQSYDITLQNAYSGSNVSLESLNTAALICKLCDDTETYDAILAIFDQQEIELEDSVKKCIKGDITFEDIFMKGTGEV